MKKWKRVSAEEAKENEYYGFGGWLLIFYIFSITLIIFFSIISFYFGENKINKSNFYYSDLFPFSMALLFVWFPIIILLPKKHLLGESREAKKELVGEGINMSYQYVPTTTILDLSFNFLWLSAGVFIPMFYFIPMNEWLTDPASYFIIFIISLNYLFLWYTVRSRRFRVTYGHHVPDE